MLVKLNDLQKRTNENKRLSKNLLIKLRNMYKNICYNQLSLAQGHNTRVFRKDQVRKHCSTDAFLNHPYKILCWKKLE